MRAKVLLNLVVEVFLTAYDKESIRLERTTLKKEVELDKQPHLKEVIVINGNKFLVTNIIYDYEEDIIELGVKNYTRLNHYDMINDEALTNDASLADFRYIYKPLDKFIDLGWEVVDNKVVKDNIKEVISKVKEVETFDDKDFFAVCFKGRILGLYKDSKLVVEHLKKNYSAKDVDDVLVYKCRVNHQTKFNEMQILMKWDVINFCLNFDVDWLKAVEEYQAKLKEERLKAMREYEEKQRKLEEARKREQQKPKKPKTTYKPKPKPTQEDIKKQEEQKRKEYEEKKRKEKERKRKEQEKLSKRKRSRGMLARIKERLKKGE